MHDHHEQHGVHLVVYPIIGCPKRCRKVVVGPVTHHGKAIVQEAHEMHAGTIVIGDVRDIADNTKTAKHLSREHRQKISNWPHGQLRASGTYKAAAFGIAVNLSNEAYTSKTCPKCGHRNKPKGRNYRCAECGFVGHRDTVGSTNILSKHTTGKRSPF